MVEEVEVESHLRPSPHQDHHLHLPLLAEYGVSSKHLPFFLTRIEKLELNPHQGPPQQVNQLPCVFSS
jgi:hypothetical protein